MNKITFRSIMLMVLFSFIYGCSDEIVETTTTSEQIPLIIKGSIEQENISRANENGFVDGDRMGVYVVDYDNGVPHTLQAEGNRANNACLTYSAIDGTWTGNTTIYWRDEVTPVDVIGYYPFVNVIDDVNSLNFEVSSDQSKAAGNGEMSGYEKSDFLWAKKVKALPTDEQIYLNFEHRLAGLKIVLQQGEGFTSEEWSKLKRAVTIENTAHKALININTGVATPLEMGEKSIIAAPQGDDIYRAVTIPQIVDGGKALIGVTIDEVSYKYVRDEATKLEQGKMHTFTLKIDKKEGGDFSLSLVNESIEPWENDKSSHDFESMAYTIINCPVEGTLQECIANANKNPGEILNLKIVGKLKDVDFKYIRTSLSQLRALNIYETTTYDTFKVKKDDTIYQYWENVLPDFALNEMSTLHHLVLPKQLEVIGQSALTGIGLSSTLVIPGSVKVLGYRCLAEIEEGDLILSDSLEYIEGHAFYENGCTFKCPLNNNIWYLGDYAFHDNFTASHSSGYFRLPESVKYIGERCFGGYGENLEGEINIPASITTILPMSFESLHFANGTKLTLHDKVERIENNAFRSLQFNNRIVWPAGLVKIGNSAFSGCNFRGGMENLPDGLSILGSYAFSQCKNLPDDLKIPLNLSQVPEYAFRLTNIKSVDIDGYTESISNNAFAYCENLTTVKIGKYVETIDASAFASCIALKSVTILNPEPPVLASDAFARCDMDHLILEVPEQSVNKYRNAQGWSDFKYITAHHELAVSIDDISCLDKGITRNMVVHCEGEWEVTECPSWCHLSQTTSNVRTTEVTVCVDASTSPREGEIVFTLKDSGNKTSCHVSQYVADVAEDTEIVLQKATEGTREIPVFIIGDGFTAQQIAEGTYLETMKKRMDEFFAIEPYKTYRNYFTVTTALAVSPEEGIGSAQTPVENKFATLVDKDVFCDYDVLRRYVKDVSSVISDANIGNALILMAMNQNIFGGATKIFDDGLTISFIPESPYDYPYDTRGQVQYYAGGCGFGRLADERVSHPEFIKACQCQYCNGLKEYYAGQAKGWYGNISLNASKTKVPWNHLIFDPHYSDIVDIFEGGYQHTRGVFRSESQSCMSTYIQYYNTISRELIVRRIMELAGESYSFEKFVSRDSREGLPQ